MFRDFFLGFVRILILQGAQQGPIYGTALIRDLKEAGYDLSPGTLYPILHAMEQAGHLRRSEHTVSGKVRKYYHLTPSGAETLAEARARVRALVAWLN
ncbi:MAG TPA: PadR family transcriptional regulator [Symbiobacteriaceae bacterium]|nr:PadR family transcriptional regulator [Symbiobacteriaceae bacterium]